MTCIARISCRPCEARPVSQIVRLKHAAAPSRAREPDQPLAGRKPHVDLVAVPHTAARRHDRDHVRAVRRDHRIAPDPHPVGVWVGDIRGTRHPGQGSRPLPARVVRGAICWRRLSLGDDRHRGRESDHPPSPVVLGVDSHEQIIDQTAKDLRNAHQRGHAEHHVTVVLPI